MGELDAIAINTQRITLFFLEVATGGVARSMIRLAQGLAERGLAVDLVVARHIREDMRANIPANVRVVELGARFPRSRTIRLIRYLRRARPTTMIAAGSKMNSIAIRARAIARASMQLIVTERSTLSLRLPGMKWLKRKSLPIQMRLGYPRADAIVAVSAGVADDLASMIGLPRHRIDVIYNPVVTKAMLASSWEPVDHPWFQPGEPPVILGVGTLTAAKDFPTLIRAFARLRRQNAARLMILGEGRDRPQLEMLCRELGVEEDVALPGFKQAPYAYMQAASVFVLSSRWEGLGNVLIEAMACGTPVVSANCPNGPAEILENGKWGHLVPVGDSAAMGDAIIEALSARRGSGVARAKNFSLENAVNAYVGKLNLHAIDWPERPDCVRYDEAS